MATRRLSKKAREVRELLGIPLTATRYEVRRVAAELLGQVRLAYWNAFDEVLKELKRRFPRSKVSDRREAAAAILGAQPELTQLEQVIVQISRC
jgi:hypothetical protein